MKNSILHITNGDSTTEILQKIDIQGDFITWREMLCEGKTTTDIGSESFWKNRYSFLKSTYHVTKHKFINFTLKEYRNLCNHKQQEEIVLWFDNDLFCQINMIGVLSWIKRYRKGYQVSLVSPKNIATDVSKGFAHLTKNQILTRFTERITLKEDDIEYADYIWQLYCSDSPLRLEVVSKFNPMSPFAHLPNAIENHLQRFPTIANGLNFVENSILAVADIKKPKSKQELVKFMLEEDKVYGFGDLQYEQKITQLSPLFTKINSGRISKKGKQVLENQLNYYRNICDTTTFLGGAKKYSYLYNTEAKKLLQITS